MAVSKTILRLASGDRLKRSIATLGDFDFVQTGE